ncbi:MAG: 16S rRNA (adenine(1518)-N(6)/adenine(1519)-N(6))-dimethyltransferase RsmA [Candidatus Omnitrophota bacterium]
MSQPSAVLAKYKVRPKKRLGQNFLDDENALNQIASAAGISKEDHVLEIGAGIGNLSILLAEKAGKFYALEKDNSLEKILKKTLVKSDNSKIIISDILQFNLDSIYKDKKLIVVGNLPYYITSPILLHLIKQKTCIKTILITVQKEVAKRITASAGNKDYGRLSCLLQFYAKAELLEIFPKRLFIPQPNVDSALVKLDILDSPSIDVKSEEMFFKVVKAIFSHRRKTLLNSMLASGSLGLSKEVLGKTLEQHGISPAIRGEQLSLKEIGKLADAFDLVIKKIK